MDEIRHAPESVHLQVMDWLTPGQKETLRLLVERFKLYPTLEAENARLRKALAIARPVCGVTMSEGSPPCACYACRLNAKIDAALGESK